MTSVLLVCANCSCLLKSTSTVLNWPKYAVNYYFSSVNWPVKSSVACIGLPTEMVSSPVCAHKDGVCVSAMQ